MCHRAGREIYAPVPKPNPRATIFNKHSMVKTARKKYSIWFKTSLRSVSLPVTSSAANATQLRKMTARINTSK